MCIALLLASACDQYWVRPDELTQARIHGAQTVAALRDGGSGSATQAPVAQLLELQAKPRSDGRVLVVDRRARQRHRRIVLFVVGGLLVVLGVSVLAPGASLVASSQNQSPCTSFCFDRGFAAIGWGMIGAGFSAAVADFAVIGGGASIRVP